MRPVRLEMEGFTAFRSPTVVDFAGAELFALVGATGAGKTSVIDALTFALYGSVPRLDDRRAVAPVVSQNLNEARVRLDFAVDGEPYTAVRVVRATRIGGATTKEARLQRGDEVVAGTADEVTAAVTERLGLSFEHFTTCVSLPQGQFARFLHDKPRSRQDLLVRLLDLGLYERVASDARHRGGLARNRAEVIAGQLDRLADATPEARAEAAARAEELAQLGRRLTAERPELDRLAEAAARGQDRADELERQVARLDELAAPADVEELAAALAGAATDRDRSAAREDEALAATVAAEERLAGLPGRPALEALRADVAQRAELVASLARGEAAETEAARGVDKAEELAAAARQQRADRAAELERVRVELRAQALVPELVVGEPCPVCGQDVHELPHVGPAPDLQRAEQAVVEAEAAVRQAEGELTQARAHQARVDEKLTRVRADLAAAEDRLAHGLADYLGTSPDGDDITAAGGGAADDGIRHNDAGTDRVGAGRDSRGHDGPDDESGEPGDSGGPADGERDLDRDRHVGRVDVKGDDGRRRFGGDGGDRIAEWVEGWLAEVSEAEAAVEKARQAARDARAARIEADRRHAALVEREREARRAFDVARDAVAALGPPPAERRDLAADWQALLAWAGQRRPTLAAGAEGQRQAAQQARRDAATRLSTLVDACHAAGVEPERTDAWPGEAVAAAQARAEETVRRIDAQLAEAEHLRNEHRGASDEQRVAEALAGHLAANRFEKWLLDEAIHKLVAGASDVLDELTGGSYALAVDERSGGFQVIDHANASQARPARTLSGGETFLASLALALALADQVAELSVAGTARLDALFLDEGFGTLDPETLDTVAAALDELGARGRMVGVVTHVRELAERLPVRFEVRKVGGAATIERIEP